MSERMPRAWTYGDRGGMGYDIYGPTAGLRGAFQYEADVRLAAAAPDMLEAAEYFEQWEHERRRGRNHAQRT